ncbi:MAG: insulinase family protein [Acidobacteria bacterium]|nr:insulinase family protein [Acidobacteriota bacterium]MBI3472885.1 insulinase family protein [Candidatus Solibacter usitatus]
MLVLALLLLAPLLGQNLKDFEKKVTEFGLANGLHFIVIERHEAPVISFNTHVKVGSLFDPGGQTGLAHMFEHMAFKGTATIGSKNWTEEKKALDAVEAVFQRLEAERRKGLRADSKEIEKLQGLLKAAIEKAELYVDTNAYPRIIESNGGVGMNAGTGLEATNYYYNFPSNRLELWFLLESERFLHPVFREFYKERDVVREERRMRVESNPQGKLGEAILTTAFMAHPYRQVPIGWASDIENLRLSEAERFYKTYYVPGNIVIGIAGDVDPAEAKRLAEKYFSRLPGAPLPPGITTIEPKQEGPRRAEIESPAQPMMFIGYKRPDHHHADDPVFDVITTVLASGRTGVLYKELVRDRKLALAAISGPNFPGSQYPNLFIFLLVPNAGKTMEENEKAFQEVLEKFKNTKIDPVTLARVKTKARAGLIRRLDSNAGLATLLPLYHVAYGEWKKMFTALDDLDKVTADDVQRVAKEYFIDNGKTVAVTFQPKKASGGAK